MSRLTFRNSPPGSYISEEGWLIVGDEAWTLAEWNNVHGAKYAIRYTNESERVAARRRSRREYMRRRRARAA